jgi:hypothetical protein
MSDEYTKQSNEFYEEVGRTLCAWQAVEVHLAMLYAQLFDTRDTFAAFESFASVASLKNKLAILEAAAIKSLDVEIVNCLKTLLDRVKRASRKHNKIAHYMYNAVADDGRIDICLGHWLREDDERSGVVRISHLKDWLGEWTALHNSVLDFASEHVKFRRGNR